jgi:HEAT repeat protein
MPSPVHAARALPCLVGSFLLALGPSAPVSGQCCGASLAPGAAGPGGAGPAGAAGTVAPGFGPTTPDDPSQASDLTDWRLWWRHNQALYLALKERVQSLGTDTGATWFIGDGQRPQKDTLRPTPEQIRIEIVPALLTVLEKEKANELLAAAVVALAKIGAGGDGAEGARIEAAITRFLADGNQRVRETAVVALGILASPRSIPALAHLLWDTPAGRKTVGATEVDYRARSFAAYGLGLVGARAESEIDRQLVVSILRRALEGDDTRSRDLEVACLIALGLVPLATVETPPGLAGARATPPERSRLAQLDYVAAFLRDERRELLARAACPVTLARLLRDAPGGPVDPRLARYRGELAAELAERVEREQDDAEILQSCVLALGQIGTSDGGALDARIRRVLASVPDEVSEPQARAFALVAAAEAGARLGQDQPGDGIVDARAFLLEELFDGRRYLRPWAGLASGVLSWGLQEAGVTDPALETLRSMLRVALEDERSPERLGAYALAAGLAQSSASVPRLTRLLDKELPDELRGQVALGLALLGHEPAIEQLREIVGDSAHRPALLRQAAIALAVLGDKDVATQLGVMLRDARSFATQAAISSALGFVGDRRSVAPLARLLGDPLATDAARAFAAAALGSVADKELLPWNAKIGIGLNYRAAPATLTDPLSRSGILDGEHF